MKNLLLFSLLLSFFSCSDADDSTSFFDINQETLAWIEPFDTYGQTFEYQNSQDSTTTLTLTKAIDSGTPLYVDCLRDDEAGQCEYKYITFTFPEGTSSPTAHSYISVALFGEDDLRLMPITGSAVSAAGVEYHENSGETFIQKPENFEAIYQDDFTYNDEEYQAITLITLSTENLAIGGLLPPERVIYVKGIGIVEYDDAFGHTWVLKD